MVQLSVKSRVWVSTISFFSLAFINGPGNLALGGKINQVGFPVCALKDGSGIILGKLLLRRHDFCRANREIGQCQFFARSPSMLPANECKSFVWPRVRRKIRTLKYAPKRRKESQSPIFQSSVQTGLMGPLSNFLEPFFALASIWLFSTNNRCMRRIDPMFK